MRIASTQPCSVSRRKAARLWRLDQRILVPGFRRVDVEGRGRDVVVAGEDHRDLRRLQIGGMGDQAIEPGELVVELRPRLGIAVGQIDRGDEQPLDRGLDIAALAVLGIAGQGIARQHRLGALGQDGDAVPGLLPPPHRAIARLAQGRRGEFAVGGLQLLQRDDVGLGLPQPGEQVRQAAVDVVDVEAGDLHPMGYRTGTDGRSRRATHLPLAPFQGARGMEKGKGESWDL